MGYKVKKMVDLNTTISIIITNINGLNTPIKRQGLSNWIKMHDPAICCLTETHFKHEDTNRLKLKGKMGKKQILQMEKGSIQQDDITALNIYAPNKRASKNMKQKLIEV